MNDLFEADIGLPAMRSLLDPLHGFQDFWNAQLPGYKIARPQCEKKWKQLKCSLIASHILAHFEFVKTSEKYQRGIILNPHTYLNQQRWLDWTSEPPKEDAYTRTRREMAERSRGTKGMPKEMRK
jgi:hypothetical protein